MTLSQSVSLFACLPVYLSVCMPVLLSLLDWFVVCLLACRSVSLSVCPFVCLSVRPSVHPYICMYVCHCLVGLCVVGGLAGGLIYSLYWFKYARDTDILVLLIAFPPFDGV